MILGSITTFAWLVKPLIGYTIDSSFTKRIWIFISLALDIVFVFRFNADAADYFGGFAPA